jgi:hypothetical protein
MYYEKSPKFVPGLDLRYLHGEVILYDDTRNAEGIYTGITGVFQF